MISSPGRTRTSDKAVNSRLLYRLSYRGSEFPQTEQLIDFVGRIKPNLAPLAQSPDQHANERQKEDEQEQQRRP